MNKEIAQKLAGLLFDFGAFLTSQKESMTVGSSHPAPPMVQAIEKFAKQRNLSLEEPDVYTWWLCNLQDLEQYRQQMAGISTAALGYWKEGDSIHPEYDTLALRDVAKLYAKYAQLFAKAVEKVIAENPEFQQIGADSAKPAGEPGRDWEDKLGEEY